MAQSKEDVFESVKYESGGTSIDIKLRTEDGTAWLTAAQIAKLYGRERSVVSKHIKNLYIEHVFDPRGTCAKNAHMPHGGTRIYESVLYNLEVVLEVGRRVRSNKGTLLSEWLKSYLGRTPTDTMIAYDAGGVSIDVRVSPSEETVWLTQSQIAELFEVSRQDISLHIKSILDERELDDTMRKYYLHMTPNGRQYQTELNNLDAILASGLGAVFETFAAIALRKTP